MDSKNIYIACSAMLRKAVWKKVEDYNEWSFVGDNEEFRSDMVRNNVNGFFDEECIYFVTDRNNSKEISKDIAAIEVRAALNKQDVTLCSKDFRRFMVFSYIGVAKHGEYHR